MKRASDGITTVCQD